MHDNDLFVCTYIMYYMFRYVRVYFHFTLSTTHTTISFVVFFLYYCLFILLLLPFSSMYLLSSSISHEKFTLHLVVVKCLCLFLLSVHQSILLLIKIKLSAAICRIFSNVFIYMPSFVLRRRKEALISGHIEAN